MIFDAGTGIRPLGQSWLTQDIPPQTYLFLSHIHWDHIQGLPFFAPAYTTRTRLRIFGPCGGQVSLAQRLSAQMHPPYHATPMHAMSAHIQITELRADGHYELPGATLAMYRLNHPGGSLGYRLCAEGKVVVYATDHEPYRAAPVTRHLSLPPRVQALAHHADLLIHDAQYTPEAYPQHIGWGHSTYLDALDLARQARVKRLVLFHHDPAHTDTVLDSIVARCQDWLTRRRAPLSCCAAAEGLRIEL